MSTHNPKHISDTPLPRWHFSIPQFLFEMVKILPIKELSRVEGELLMTRQEKRLYSRFRNSTKVNRFRLAETGRCVQDGRVWLVDSDCLFSLAEKKQKHRTHKLVTN